MNMFQHPVPQGASRSAMNTGGWWLQRMKNVQGEWVDTWIFESAAFSHFWVARPVTGNLDYGYKPWDVYLVSKQDGIVLSDQTQRYDPISAIRAIAFKPEHRKVVFECAAELH